MKAENIVRFENPVDENEKNALMIVLEMRETRALVCDLRFSQWGIPPTDVYAMSDLRVVSEYLTEISPIQEKQIVSH